MHAAIALGPSTAATVRKPSVCNWSNRSSTFAGTSSATRMRGGSCSVSIRRLRMHLQPEAEVVATLAHTADARACLVQQRHVQRHAVVRNRDSDATAERCLLNCRRSNREWERSPPDAEPNEEREAAPEARTAGLDAQTQIIRVDSDRVRVAQIAEL